MKNIQAFVNNISFPTSLEELEFFLKDDGLYNIEMILFERDTSEWTAPRWCKIDDISFSCTQKILLLNI